METILRYKEDDHIKVGSYNMEELPNGLVVLNIKLFEGTLFSKKGENYFTLLQEIRSELISKQIELLCNGASKNVFPSAMQMDMGGGERAYRLKMGVHSYMDDIVEIMDYDESHYIESSVESQKEFYEKWVLSKKKLEVRTPRYTVDKVKINSPSIYFWGHQPSKDGSIGKSCLSQWWPSKFVDSDGNKYSSTEQWMMAEKARVFSDRVVLEQILETDNPKEAKTLGRKVSFFDNEVWSKRAYDIVVEGNLLKFSQNKELKDYLLSTEDAIIVEASPYDKIWGIGMKQDDEGIEDPKNWKGENLLGFALMEVRDLLKEQDHPA